MEVPANLSMSEFEDPINFELLSNVIRCPHYPSHNYQIGTLKKRMEKGIEYTQCSLTNEWFPSSEFKRDEFSSKAVNKIYQLNEANRQINEEKERLSIEAKLLNKEILDLTEYYKNEIATRDKTIEEWKKMFINQQEEARAEKEKDMLAIQTKFENMIKEDRESIRKLHEIIELQAIKEKETSAKLLVLMEKKPDDSMDIWKNHIYKISLSIFSSGIIVLACKKIYSKVMDVL